ncbi:MAG TPA: hypothetical protein VH969_19260, partial [Actinophytocola sp.]|uniref:hypothetical protein n=1 Tax=Actinophytocola sp. TaxID=1872138 RepID=UPI002F94041E
RDFQNGGGICTSIDADVAVEVSKVYYTDRDVRLVGLAFQRAGSSGIGPMLPYHASDKAVAAEFDALAKAAEHQAEMAAGKALADKMTNRGDPDNLKWISRQLALHGSDGYFAAGFFNALSADQIARLMGHDDQALANALATGAVDQRTAHNIVMALEWTQGSDFSPQHWHITERTQLAVLQALANNRTAARNFADLLSAKDLHRLIDLSRDSDDGKVFSQVFNVLSQAALTHGTDPDAMRAFMNRVSAAMKGVDLSFVPGSAAALLQFVSVGIAGSVADPGPGRTPAELLAWAKRQGVVMDEILAPFLTRIAQSNAGRDALDNAVNGILVGSLPSILPWTKVVKTGSTVLDNMVINGLQSWTGVKDQDLYAKVLGTKRPSKTDALQFAQSAVRGPGQVAMWTMLAKNGYLVDVHNRPVDLTSDGGGSSSPFLTARQSKLNDLAAHPENYHLKGDSNIDLETLDNDFGSSVSLANPDSRSLAAIRDAK